MITELMLILMVVGAGIILVVWTNSRKRKRVEMDRQEVAESANEFKVELEKTANEIIGRMETQANHLESLLDDSERNRAQLEGRVTELKKLLKRTESQSTEIRDLLERLDDAVEDVDTMQKQMDAIEKKINSALNAQIPQNPILSNVPQIVPPPMLNPLMQTAPITQTVTPQPVINPIPAQVVAPPPIIHQPVSPVQTPPPIVEKVAEEKKPQEDFSKVLEKTMQEEEPAPKTPRIHVPPDRNSIVLSREIKTPAKVVAAEPVKIETTRKKFEPTGSIAERQAKVLAERKNRMTEKKVTPSGRSEDIRKAAMEAIKNAVENEKTIDISPSTEELKTTERLQALKERAENIADKVVELPPVKSENVNIREMLLSGMSVEEVARETGLGRGAVELVQQMTKRQLERK